MLNTTTNFTNIDELNANARNMTIDELKTLSNVYETLYLKFDNDENYALQTHFNIMLNTIDNYIIKRENDEMIEKITNIVREMTINACDEIGFPYDELCTETVINDLHATYNVKITNVKKIDYRLMSTIAECVEKFATETEFNFSDVIIEHYINSNK